MSKASTRIGSTATSKRLSTLRIFGIPGRRFTSIGGSVAQLWQVSPGVMTGAEAADSMAVLRTTEEVQLKGRIVARDML
jgi:hypothetical protein